MVENAKIWACVGFLACPVQLWADAFPVKRCVNLSNALEAPAEGDWGYTITASDIAAIASDGFDTIRLPVRFSVHFDGGLSEQILARTDEVIQTALDEDLNVILDLHHFHELTADPEKYAPAFQAIWAELSQHYAGWDDRLMFELLNEAEGNLTTTLADVLFDEAIETIRELHPNRWVIIGGGDWNDWRQLKNLRQRDGKTVKTFHYYAPFDFTHQTAEWVDLDLPRRSGPTQAELAKIREEFSTLRQSGDLLLLGEFGVYQVVPPAERAKWMETVRRAAEDAEIGWCHWGYTSGFRIKNKDKEWLPQLREALFDK